MQQFLFVEIDSRQESKPRLFPENQSEMVDLLWAIWGHLAERPLVSRTGFCPLWQSADEGGHRSWREISSLHELTNRDLDSLLLASESSKIVQIWTYSRHRVSRPNTCRLRRTKNTGVQREVGCEYSCTQKQGETGSKYTVNDSVNWGHTNSDCVMSPATRCHSPWWGTYTSISRLEIRVYHRLRWNRPPLNRTQDTFGPALSVSQTSGKSCSYFAGEGRERLEIRRIFCVLLVYRTAERDQLGIEPACRKLMRNYESERLTRCQSVVVRGDLQCCRPLKTCCITFTRIYHLILRLVMIGTFAHVEALWHSFHCVTVCLGTKWVTLCNNCRGFNHDQSQN